MAFIVTVRNSYYNLKLKKGGLWGGKKNPT